MANITMAQALNAAILEEMERDETLVISGENVGKYAGVFKVTANVYEKFGAKRAIDTPIAEATIIGTAVGMALGGMKVCAELMYADFVDCAMDEIFDKLGKWRYMHGGYFDIPVTVRLPVGIAGGAGPEHGRSTQAQFMNSQGLYIVIPSTPYDAKGLMKYALRGKNPVLFFEPKTLYGIKGEVPDEEYMIPFGVADIKREGTDVTIVATARQVVTSLAAAEKLAKEGISVEVLDPRTLIPFDKEALFKSLKKTGRLVIAHEEAKTGGTGAEIAALVAEEMLLDMKAPIRRVAAPDVPIAQSIHLEKYYIPSEEQIMDAVKDVLKF